MTFRQEYARARQRVRDDQLSPWWRDVGLPDLDRAFGDLEEAPYRPQDVPHAGGFVSQGCEIAVREWRFLQHRWGEKKLRHFCDVGFPYLPVIQPRDPDSEALRHRAALLPPWLTRPRIHTLHHLAVWEAATGKPLELMNGAIVEWGGGHGQLAELLFRLTDPRRYVIVDLPPVSLLQQHYLHARLTREQRDRVCLVSSLEEAAAEVEGMPHMFISTWALSEATTSAILAADRWLSSSSVLLAYDVAVRETDFPVARKLAALARGRGLREVPAAVDGSVYAVR